VVDDEAYDLEISIHTPFEKLAIRPTSFGIVPSVTGETVQIHLDEPKKFTVETDGGLHDALFVFCSRRIEKPENTTICFEKGKVYNVGVLTLKPNDTVYIEEGAVVSGCIYADHCDNISIIGNGIVNGACWHLPDSNAHRFFIYIKWCNNVLLKGFTAVDGPSWHVVPAACDHVVIDDMNIMSRIVTGDGIDITSSQDVEVKNCFIRSTDDSICIKAHGLIADTSTVRDVTKVYVHNNVLWNAEPGNAIELGYGLQSEIHDLVFEDCDIIHCQYEGNMGGAAISIHQADGGHVHDVHYRNIRVEQAEQKLFDIKVLLCKYTQQVSKGEINDIHFDNIQVLNGDIPVSLIRGYQTPTEEVRVHDITFDNITFMGKKCETWQDLRLVTELANDIYVNGVRTCKQMKF
ncbi:glycosyl hydrolase family 28 protein, partial [Gallintestinimicrobium sp.]